MLLETVHAWGSLLLETDTPMLPRLHLQELDTTLQVLGIDGLAAPPAVRVTASPHAPSVGITPTGGGVQRSASVASSSVWSPRAGRATSEAGYRFSPAAV